MGVLKSRFGGLEDGRTAELYTLCNSKGMSIEVSNYGATLVAVNVPDRNGKLADVVLGYEEVVEYAKNGGYFGAVIGRNGNRIGKAEVTINGTTYPLDKNDNGNNLHSGFHGFDRVIWAAEVSSDGHSICFTHHSEDMDQGFPGNFDVSVTYTLTEDNEVKLQYQGQADQDTIANLTNHSYFNLAGQDCGTVLEHKIRIDADTFTVIDEESIPTGELRAVAGTPMDFRTMKKIGAEIDSDYQQLQIAGGYDHNFALNHADGTIRKCIEVWEEQGGRKMEVYTDCPGVQFYTGNYIDERIGKEGAKYDKRSGFCLETQHYPDNNHYPAFPSSILKAGERYQTTTIYRFSCM